MEDPGYGKFIFLEKDGKRMRDGILDRSFHIVWHSEEKKGFGILRIEVWFHLDCL